MTTALLMAATVIAVGALILAWRPILDAFRPPWHLPSWQELAFIIIVVSLARGWYDERGRYNDMYAVSLATGMNIEECRTVVMARLDAAEERLEWFRSIVFNAGGTP